MSYNNSPRIVTNGLVLLLDAANTKSYPGTGTSWFDLSGNNNNGTLINGPTFSSNNYGSILFDQTNDLVACGNNAGIQITIGTISAWFRATNQNTAIHAIIAKQSAWGLFVWGNTLRTYDWGNIAIRDTTRVVGDNSWHFAAMTFSQTVGTPSNNAIIYLDSVQVLNTTVRHSNHNITLQIGEANASQYFGGNIAQASVYNRVLSSSEISQNYNATKGRFGL